MLVIPQPPARVRAPMTMEFINPRLTIQNVESTGMHAFLVRMEHVPNEGEKLDITLLIRGPDLPEASIDQLQQRVIQRAVQVLQAMQH
jgi:hypothetical protein